MKLNFEMSIFINIRIYYNNISRNKDLVNENIFLFKFDDSVFLQKEMKTNESKSVERIEI